MKRNGYGRNSIAAIGAVLLLSGCAVLANGADSLRPQSFGEETRRQWCEALLENAPSASSEDSAQTQEEVADIGEVIWILCREYVDAS
jgi:ABC-type Fe3+ transport system substrate-binding protein